MKGPGKGIGKGPWGRTRGRARGRTKIGKSHQVPFFRFMACLKCLPCEKRGKVGEDRGEKTRVRAKEKVRGRATRAFGKDSGKDLEKD